MSSTKKLKYLNLSDAHLVCIPRYSFLFSSTILSLETKTLNTSKICFFFEVSGLKYNKLLAFVIVLLLALFSFSTFVLAQSTVSVKPVNDLISPLESAEFDIVVSNQDTLAQSYVVYSFVQGWNIDPNPITDRTFKIAAGQSRTVRLVSTPTTNFPAGIYNLAFSVESDSGDRYTDSMKVFLSPEKQLDYLPAIKVDVDMDEKIDPNKPLSIKLFLENRNPLDLSGLVVKLQSDMPEFQKEVTIDLPPLQKKSVEFSITPNKYQQPKDYLIFFVFEHKGEVAKIQEQKIEILTVLPVFDVAANSKMNLLKKSTLLTIKNGGNVLNAQEVKHPVPFWQAILSRGADNVVREEGQSYLVWGLELAPGESVDVSYTTNYRLPLYLLILITVFFIFYYSVRSPVAIKKTAITTRSDDEGSLSEIKVTLEVLNRSKKPLVHASITDLVPAIANVQKSLELGTLKPHEIRHAKTGTKVVWSLAELDAHEHRLITYKIRAKLNILGTFQLPRAVVEFKEKKRKKKAYSNVFRLQA